MAKLIISAPASTYTGVRGSGPVLGAGSHLVHIPANGIVLTDDSISNPYGMNTESKTYPWDVHYSVMAVKFTNHEGGVTERYHFFGFELYGDLTEAQKAEGKTVNGVFVPRYSADPEKGYAIEDYIGPDGKKVAIETGELKADGTPVKRAARTRVINAEKSATATRIFGDFMAACKVPVAFESDGKTLKETSMEEKYEALLKAQANCQLQIVVKSEEYGGKKRSKVVSVAPIGTAVPTQEAAATAAPAPVVDEVDEF
jgi:hypothetical protein